MLLRLSYKLLCSGILCILILPINQSYSQQVTVNKTADSVKIQKYLDVVDSLFYSSNFNRALDEIEKAKTYFEQFNLKDNLAHINTRKGSILRLHGNYIEALKLFTEVLSYYKAQGNIKGQASVENQLGAVYRLQGKYPKALEYYFNSLKLYQTIGGKKGESSTLNNIGIVYEYQNNFDKALDYYNQSLKIEQQLNNEEGIGLSYLNIGGVYLKKNDFNQALDFYLKALVIAKKGNDLDAIGVIYNEVGIIQLKKHNYQDAKYYLDQALSTFQKIGSKFRLAECEVYFGHYYTDLKDYADAIKHFEIAAKIARETGSMEIYTQTQHQLSNLYEKVDNPGKALAYYKIFITSRDSLFSKENTEKSIQSEMLYKFEKEQEAIRIEQAKKDAIAEEKAQRQTTTRNFLIAILALSIILIGIIYIAYRNKRNDNLTLKRQREEILEKNEELIQQQEEILTQRDQIEEKNTILEKSKQIIAEKNERIISSIEYAQTIQQAILPDEEILNCKQLEHFVLYLPKDIVSGDFYWFNKIDNIVFAAVVDCTGHGVPGSFMSLIGNTLLNQIINEWQTTDPALVLEYLNQKVRKALRQDEQHSKSHVSMDVCLVKIDLSRQMVTFAGARRPLYIIQNGKFEKLPGDIRSVGGVQRETKKDFTNHEFAFTESTYLYLTTDGYIDQMNPEGRKLGFNKLSSLLLENHTKPMEVQKQILIESLEDQSQGGEQIDDICILGLKF